MASSRNRSLSDLPPGIVDAILIRLPIRDAVRTSILSPWWRHRWQSILDLRFDADSDSDSDASSYHQVRAVDHVLLLQRGPIRSFSLSSSHHHHHDASRWLASLAADPDPLLSLSLLFTGVDGDGDGDGGFPICSTLFSFRSLTHLNLRGCTLTGPSPLGFPCLQTLSLRECDSYYDYGSLSDLISNCPLLQKLILRDNQCHGSFHVGGPNLRSLHFCGWFEEFVLVDAPFLTMVSICVNSIGNSSDYDDDDADENEEEDDDAEDDENDNADGGYRYAETKWDVTEMFRRVRCIEKLELLNFTVNYLGLFSLPKRIDGSFEKLKFLELNANFDNVKEALPTLCLLRSTPNLQALEIGPPLKRKSIGQGREFWQQQDPLELPKLHTLKISCFSYAPADLEFLEFILPKALELKKLDIHVALEEDGSFDELKFKELKKHLEAFTRAEIL